MKNNVKIVTDCLCDVTKSILEKNNIGCVYYRIQTDKGVFMDTEEITVNNVLSYYAETGNIPISIVPTVEDYKKSFEEILQDYPSVIYVSCSSKINETVDNVKTAIKELEAEDRITIFDTGSLSTGQGMMVLSAAEMAIKDMSTEEILHELKLLKERVSVSFIVPTTDFLYMNGQIPKKLKSMCDLLSAHPVLHMKNGVIALDYFLFGDYENCCKKYLKKLLKNVEDIDNKRLFITQAGSPVRIIQMFKNEIEKTVICEKLEVTDASATVACNSGPDTIGVAYIKKQV